MEHSTIKTKHSKQTGLQNICILLLANILMLTGTVVGGGIEKRVPPTRVGHIVGLGGTILVSTNGGKTWVTQATSNDHRFTAVEFRDNNTGIAVGKNNQIYLSVDGGSNWSSTSMHFTQPYYNCTSVATGSDVAGGRRMLQASTPQKADFSHSRKNSTADADTGMFCSLEGTMVNYYDCSWFDSLTAIVIGSQLTKHLGQGQERMLMLRTTDNGRHWATIPSGGAALLYSVASGSPLHGVAVGDSGVAAITVDGGTMWSRVNTGTIDHLNGVDYIDSMTYVAVGSNGAILRSTNGGFAWNEVASTVAENLRHVEFSPNGNGVAVGDNGTILRTLDYGCHWVAKESGTHANLLDVGFFSDGVVVAIGEHGTILRSEDNGDRWYTLDRITNESLTHVSFVQPR